MENCVYARETRSGLNMTSNKVYKTISALIILSIYVIMTIPAVHAEDASGDSGGADFTVSDTGMEAASALATVVYFPAKAIFALGGGVVGGLTYAFTGGNEEAANKVWHTSMEGDYMIEPENLTGKEPVNFIGPDI